MDESSEVATLPFDFRYSVDSGAWLVKKSKWWMRATSTQERQILEWINGTHGLDLTRATR